MQKGLIFSLMLFLVLGIMVGVPVILAQETSEDPGITPDSFLWGLDRALEQISLLLATSPSSKATKGLEHAQERLAEIKVMIEENKLDAAKKAEESHGETLAEVQENIDEIEEDNSTEEMEEIIEIEKELQDHKDEVDQVFGELKIKIKVEGDITPSQQTLIDSILASLEGQTGEVEIEIKNKKDRTRIKIKIETGKSDEEIDDDIEKLEIKSGLSRIKVKAEIVGSQSEVKIERRFSTTTTDRDAIIQEIIEEFALDREMADIALKLEEEDEDEELEEKFKVKVKVKDGMAKVEIKLKFILDATDRESILDAVVARSILTADQIESAMKFEDKELEEDELEIEVEIEDGVAEVEVELNGNEFEFELETTDRNEIIDEIIERTGLTREQINAVIEFDVKDEDKEDEIACTQDVKECGDGTTVSRNPDLDCAFNQCPDKETDVDKITVELAMENDSGESGKAKLVEENGQVTVTVSLDGAPENVSQPAHIHLGSCPGIGGIQYPLTNVLNGESTTTIDATLDQLESELPLAINIHKSVDEASVYVSCGDIIFN